MLNTRIDHWLSQVPQLDKLGHALAHTVHNAVLNSGRQVRDWVDVLHGTWLGHPLHPVLIEGVIGAWTFATVLDFVSLTSRAKGTERAADILVVIGNYTAVPTVLSGLADYSTIPHPATKAGLAHAAINGVGYMLQLSSASARKQGNRSSAVALSSTATLLLLVGAYLGGHLVYDKKVGVNHSEPANEPKEWTPVMEVADLVEEKPLRQEVAGKPVLFYRKGERVLAIGAICAHAGGPLDQGTFFDNCVQCPWHDSVFNLEDGTVVHGPSTYAVPNYETRTHNGTVEVRVPSSAQ